MLEKHLKRVPESFDDPPEDEPAKPNGNNKPETAS